MFQHFIAELECFLFGHIDYRGNQSTPSERKLEPVEVFYQYANGTSEKVADNICANCGHFITNGRTHIRGSFFTPDYLRTPAPVLLKEKLKNEEITKKNLETRRYLG